MAVADTKEHDAREAESFHARRLKMVEHSISARGVRDDQVLDAMRKVPRELFVPERLREFAYDDSPLPIANGQTISQPYIVALRERPFADPGLALTAREVAIEGDWPDAARVDHCVRQFNFRPSEWTAFARFPTWMWRNVEVRDFIEWLRKHNGTLTEDRRIASGIQRTGLSDRFWHPWGLRCGGMRMGRANGGQEGSAFAGR